MKAHGSRRDGGRGSGGCEGVAVLHQRFLRVEGHLRWSKKVQVHIHVQVQTTYVTKEVPELCDVRERRSEDGAKNIEHGLRLGVKRVCRDGDAAAKAEGS